MNEMKQEQAVNPLCTCNPDGKCAASPEGRRIGRVSIVSEIRCRAACEVVVERAQAVALLEAAAQHMRDRAAVYDRPEGERSMAATVEAFNRVTGRDLRESEGWLLMTLLKLVRSEQRTAPHRDSVEDAVAYQALYGEARLAGK